MLIEKSNAQFTTALAISYNWLLQNEYEILSEIADAYKVFFNNLKISKSHTLEEMKTIF